MLDFTQKMYHQLCQAISKAGYQTTVMGDYFDTSESDKPRLMLRHDVDRDAGLALEMARIEQQHGLASTYMFRVVDSVFKPDIIKQIADLGMEIGYHYECLDKAQGDYTRAFEIAKDDLAKLRELAPVKVMAMHGNPLTKWDNRDLWKQRDFKDIDIAVAAYLNIDYKKVRYFSDTGRSWDEQRGNIYDFVGEQPEHALKTTPDLIDYIGKHHQDTCILIHPNRWSDKLGKWFYNWAYDTAGNTVKALIKLIR
ncbi:MAG: hypothetical protein GY839_00845 [candidate division Zixibacteria bacterium]|nr:hypothetical protein [candidate division Zixibacteria bacterium]